MIPITFLKFDYCRAIAMRIASSRRDEVFQALGRFSYGELPPLTVQLNPASMALILSNVRACFSRIGMIDQAGEDANERAAWISYSIS
jgi:hypothetical protein